MTATETAPTAAAPTHLDAINWFEIPTLDLDRATAFYEMMLATKLTRALTAKTSPCSPALPPP